MGSAAVEEKFIALTRSSSPITEAEVEAVFNQLKPIQPEDLIGEWDGGSLDTGHPSHQKLQAMRWAGKVFRSVDDADPIVVHDENGHRVLMSDFGHSSVRQMVFRGVVSAAMIYDQKPIFDHFRYVSDEMVAGAMEAPKVMGPTGTYYFYLVRRKESSK
ncbi:hypothetical protein ETB97_007000 [Aspergillus alliaceus]|uniref:Uncharacterized protein n=1 Tax=Petromyces alliaceus TaxID=209559 RepID=A0A8H5ZVY3_PETAA|nr:hypothetical protein ETB97_007000 [Aspergillus burnettii]